MTEKQEKIPVLTEIQNELHAPKNQYNSFGKYKYRSAEDIEQALKPILLRHNSMLFITDQPVLQGDWHYIKSTVTLKTPDLESPITVTAYAREEVKKKGQDTSQTTGSTSSYARKYALGGLFLIDDTKDADAQPPVRTTRYNKPKPVAKQPVANRSKAAEEDKKLITWKVNYLNTETPLVNVVKSMADGDKGAQKFLHNLNGNDKVAAAEIYKRALYLGV